MATQTLTNIANYLKKDYLDAIRGQINSSSVLYYRAEKNEEDVSGEDLTAVITLHHGRNQGIGARAEGGTLPTAGARTHKRATVAMAYLYGSVKISGQAIAGSRNRETRLAKVVDDEVNGMIEGVRVDVNRQLHGRGTGAIARFAVGATGNTSVAAGTTIAVDDASRLEEGMVIDSHTTNAGSGGTPGLNGVVIDQVDVRNNKITLTTNPGTDENGDYIYRDDSRGFEMMGLEGIVDGQDSAGTRLITTFQGLSRATYFWWEGNVIDNGGALQDISFNRVQRGFELGEIVAGGRTTMMMSHYDLRRSYLDLCAADKRYVNMLTLDGGFKALEYTGGGDAVPWTVDRHCLKNRLFCLDESSLAIFRASDFDWMDKDGAVLARVSGKDEYEATCFAYMNFGTYKSAANTVIRDQR